jgi:hypothetical protein
MFKATFKATCETIRAAKYAIQQRRYVTGAALAIFEAHQRKSPPNKEPTTGSITPQGMGPDGFITTLLDGCGFARYWLGSRNFRYTLQREIGAFVARQESFSWLLRRLPGHASRAVNPTAVRIFTGRLVIVALTVVRGKYAH